MWIISILEIQCPLDFTESHNILESIPILNSTVLHSWIGFYNPALQSTDIVRDLSIKS